MVLRLVIPWMWTPTSTTKEQPTDASFPIFWHLPLHLPLSRTKQTLYTSTTTPLTSLTSLLAHTSSTQWCKVQPSYRTAKAPTHFYVTKCGGYCLPLFDLSVLSIYWVLPSVFPPIGFLDTPSQTWSFLSGPVVSLSVLSLLSCTWCLKAGKLLDWGSWFLLYKLPNVCSPMSKVYIHCSTFDSGFRFILRVFEANA